MEVGFFDIVSTVSRRHLVLRHIFPPSQPPSSPHSRGGPEFYLADL